MSFLVKTWLFIATAFSQICLLMSMPGYVANFRVDLRNGTSTEAMMREVLDDYNVPGTEVFADNLFVSVAMLRWCKEHHYNLAGTTRRSYGFPKELVFDDLAVGVCICFICVLFAS